MTGNGTNTIALQDSGNDIVEVGTGSNTVTGGSGRDPISGAGVHDSLVAGSGAHSVLYDSGDFATLVGGSGHGDVLVAGGGTDESLVAGGRHAELWGGSGSGDVLFAGRHFARRYSQGRRRSPGVSLRRGQRRRTLCRRRTRLRNRKWHAGGRRQQRADPYRGPWQRYDQRLDGSGNAVFFDSQAYGTGSGITIATGTNGVTTVSFADTGQHFTISGIQTLNFSDGHVVHL